MISNLKIPSGSHVYTNMSTSVIDLLPLRFRRAYSCLPLVKAVSSPEIEIFDISPAEIWGIALVSRPTQQTRDTDSMFIWCWSTVFNAGPTINKHWVKCLVFAGWTSSHGAIINKGTVNNLSVSDQKKNEWGRAEKHLGKNFGIISAKDNDDNEKRNRTGLKFLSPEINLFSEIYGNYPIHALDRKKHVSCNARPSSNARAYLIQWKGTYWPKAIVTLSLQCVCLHLEIKILAEISFTWSHMDTFGTTCGFFQWTKPNALILNSPLLHVSWYFQPFTRTSGIEDALPTLNDKTYFN